MPRRPVSHIVILLLSGALSTAALRAQTYPGHLDPSLSVDAHTSSPVIFDPISPADAQRLGVAAAPSDTLFTGDLSVPRNDGLHYKVVVIHRADATDILYLDRNRNGHFEASERLSFHPADNSDPRLKSTVTTDVELPDTRFSKAPMQVSLVRGKPPFAIRPDQLVIVYTAVLFLQGEATLPESKVALRFQYNPISQSVSLNDGLQCVDLNGDGQFDPTPASGEFLRAHGASPIFQIGAHTLQVSSVDVKAKSFSIASISASQDRRIPLTVGAQLPDFTYHDFSGAERKLSDLKGRYLLLSFWATWCAPCMAELPKLKESYATYHPKGFEILAIDGDESPDKPKSVIQKEGLPWSQAQYDADLLNNRFQISLWPTLVLVDLREGKRTILSGGLPDHLPLDADHLSTTLSTVIGP